ncbi:SET domain-containing protein [Fistulina hepatica ATCC 64428]|uniref:SET domain-containing protein n=1 Tax=Fistulina hepatica ATCC 64428 TaxID=1128425 RepID=A0A0D7A155_9AGAR|nr:SET domain-containing protein [Fistulina hepatica ATCC 64428]
MDQDTRVDAFLDWFSNIGGWLDTDNVALNVFSLSEGGRGMVAVHDIPAEQTLFTIPRSCWRKYGLHRGWRGAILCLMWEATLPKWAGYIDILPSTFETPVFWPDEDLAELKGTSVLYKIGKADADRDYETYVLPAMQSRPDLFRPALLSTAFSLQSYHVNGSRLLSRSFQVEKPDDHGDSPDEDAVQESANKSSTMESSNAMDVDAQSLLPDYHEQQEGDGNPVDDNDSDSDDEDGGDVSMVPMADMLNARYGCENAKLFYETDKLKMVSTKPIKAGEQVWNTYGDLPNCDLLRRYGHVDVLSGDVPNPADVVEISADKIVQCVKASKPTDDESVRSRIDWWLENGGDDVFVLELPAEVHLPQAMISFVRLLQLTPTAFDTIMNKSKLPKGKLKATDDDSANVLDVVRQVLVLRGTEYVGGGDPQVRAPSP